MKKLTPGQYYDTNYSGLASDFRPILDISERSIIMVIKTHSTSIIGNINLEIFLNGCLKRGWIRNEFVDKWSQLNKEDLTMQDLIPGKLYKIEWNMAASIIDRVLPYWYLGGRYGQYKQLNLPIVLLYLGSIENFSGDEAEDSYKYHMKHVFMFNNNLIKVQNWPNIIYKQIL